MNVLIACEFSGIVRDAFRAHGHYAMSCDLLPTERPGPHYQGDVTDCVNAGWDLMIAHPPCTHLAVSGARWFAGKLPEQQAALAFVDFLLNDTPIPRIALENPVSIISSRIRKPDQIVQPWWFGHPETKATCLWLRNLPPLVPRPDAQAVRAAMLALPAAEAHRVHHASPGPERWKERSRTLTGLAEAMAAQWGEPHDTAERSNPLTQ